MNTDNKNRTEIGNEAAKDVNGGQVMLPTRQDIERNAVAPVGGAVLVNKIAGPALETAKASDDVI